MYISIVDENKLYRGMDRSLTSGCFKDDENFGNLVKVYFDYIEHIEIRGSYYESIKNIPGGIISKFKYFLRYDAKCELIIADKEEVDIDEELELLGIDVVREQETMISSRGKTILNDNGLFDNIEDAIDFIEDSEKENLEPYYVYRLKDDELKTTLRSFDEGWIEKLNNVFIDKVYCNFDVVKTNILMDIFDSYLIIDDNEYRDIYILICKDHKMSFKNKEITEMLLMLEKDANIDRSYFVVMPSDSQNSRDCTYQHNMDFVHYINLSRISKRFAYDKRCKYNGFVTVKKLISLYKNSTSYCKHHENAQVDFSYYCEKYNQEVTLSSVPVVDESKIANEPLYIHRFVDEDSNEYGIITESLGKSMPFCEKNNFLVLGTRKKIYYVDIAKCSISREIELSSKCMDIYEVEKKMVVICEKEVLVIDEEGNCKSRYKGDEYIVRYTVKNDKVSLLLMNGKKKSINFQNRLDIFGLFR